MARKTSFIIITEMH